MFSSDIALKNCIEPIDCGYCRQYVVVTGMGVLARLNLLVHSAVSHVIFRLEAPVADLLAGPIKSLIRLAKLRTRHKPFYHMKTLKVSGLSQNTYSPDTSNYLPLGA